MQVETNFVKQRFVALIRNTTKVIGNVLQGVSQEEATTYRDGPDGWTVTEIVCHVRDFGVIYHERAKQVLTEDNPTFPRVDQEALARERHYNDQNVQQAYAELAANYEAIAAFFEGITDEAAWDRIGQHPEQGPYTLNKILMQVGTHTTMHIEQMTRVLTQKYGK